MSDKVGVNNLQQKFQPSNLKSSQEIYPMPFLTVAYGHSEF